MKPGRTDPPPAGAGLQDWLDWQSQLHPSTIDLGLERVRAVAERLELFPWPLPTVTVAGTNGKGSTVAFIEAGLLASGQRTLAYTSPHLLRYNERVRIAGQPVTDAALIHAFEAIEQARGEISLSYFEYGTLAALWLARQQAVDVVVLEVGLGGRLDAVNIIDADVAVITRIGLDHQDWLGDNRESIGREKAGIARSGRPLICSDRQPPASIAEAAAELGAPLLQLGRDFQLQPQAGGWYWQQGGQVLHGPPLAMAGTWQGDNLAGALAALYALERKRRIPLNWPALPEALAAVRVPGRLQPWPGDARVWMDVGHNPAALEALQPWLAAHAPLHLVFAALEDKDLPAMAAALHPHVGHWWLAGLDVPRGLSAETLAARMGIRPDGLFPAPAMALAHARAVAGADETVLVCGSFFTVAAVCDPPPSGKSG